MKQFLSTVKQRLLAWGVYPRSGLARFTVWVVGLYVLSQVLAKVFSHVLSQVAAIKWSGIFSDWANLFEFVAICTGTWLLIRWIRNKVLWRLRNRLIVTYVFIGVIPVVLILTMVGIAGYILGNQLTTMLVHRDLQAEVLSLDTLNATVSLEITDALKKKPSGPLHLASLELLGPTQRFPEWTIAAWLNGNQLQLANATAPRPELADRSRDTDGVIAFDRSFLIRTFRSTKTAVGTLQVVAVVPITTELLS